MNFFYSNGQFVDVSSLVPRGRHPKFALPLPSSSQTSSKSKLPSSASKNAQNSLSVTNGSSQSQKKPANGSDSAPGSGPGSCPGPGSGPGSCHGHGQDLGSGPEVATLETKHVQNAINCFGTLPKCDRIDRFLDSIARESQEKTTDVSDDTAISSSPEQSRRGSNSEFLAKLKQRLRKTESLHGTSKENGDSGISGNSAENSEEAKKEEVPSPPLLRSKSELRPRATAKCEGGTQTEISNLRSPLSKQRSGLKMGTKTSASNSLRVKPTTNGRTRSDVGTGAAAAGSDSGSGSGAAAEFDSKNDGESGKNLSEMQASLHEDLSQAIRGLRHVPSIGQLDDLPPQTQTAKVRQLHKVTPMRPPRRAKTEERAAAYSSNESLDAETGAGSANHSPPGIRENKVKPFIRQRNLDAEAKFEDALTSLNSFGRAQSMRDVSSAQSSESSGAGAGVAPPRRIFSPAKMNNNSPGLRSNESSSSGGSGGGSGGTPPLVGYRHSYAAEDPVKVQMPNGMIANQKPKAPIRPPKAIVRPVAPPKAVSVPPPPPPDHQRSQALTSASNGSNCRDSRDSIFALTGNNENASAVNRDNIFDLYRQLDSNVADLKQMRCSSSSALIQVSDRVQKYAELCSIYAENISPHNKFRFRELVSKLDGYIPRLRRCASSVKCEVDQDSLVNELEATVGDLMQLVQR